MRDSAATVGVGIDDELLDEILLEIYNEEVDEVSGISPTLYTANRDYFHKAIDDGIINSANAAIDLETSWIDALKHSADVFSLHRTANQCALLAESMIDADGNLKSFEQFKKDTQAINNHYNKAWLRTEYDTAVLRTQMGADWMMFMKDADVLPNLRWMQTTSVNPREEHREFWANNLTLPIDDPFWDKHRPGDQWNCKCWLEQTDAPRTALEDMPDSADIPEPKAGLRGNTAKTKEIFSQDHPHFPHSCATCHLNADGKVHGVNGGKIQNAKKKVIGVCCNCRISRDKAAEIEQMNKREQVGKKLEQSLKTLVDNKVVIKKSLEDLAHTISVRFSPWGNRHLVADAMQTKHSKVFKINDLKNIEDIVSGSEYFGFAVPEKLHSHDITKFYYFKTELHGEPIYVNIGEVKKKDKNGKTKTYRYVYSITDKLFH